MIQINLYKKKKLDPAGWFLEVEEGDVPVSHATIVIDGVEYTTGARNGWCRWGWGPLYGGVPTAQYQAGRSFYACEFVDPLTLSEKAALLASCHVMDGMPYGFDTIGMLLAKKYAGAGFIDKLEAKPKLIVDHPICSEAVVDHCWFIDRMVCRKQGKLEPRACTPGSLWMAAIYSDVIRIVKEVA